MTALIPCTDGRHLYLYLYLYTDGRHLYLYGHDRVYQDPME